MAHDPDTPGKRRLPLWARMLLGLATVPVMIVGPLVVIGLWPGLNFQWSKGSTIDASTCGIARVSNSDRSLLAIKIGVGVVGWERFHGIRNPSPERGVEKDRGVLQWEADTQRILIVWRRLR